MEPGTTLVPITQHEADLINAIRGIGGNEISEAIVTVISGNFVAPFELEDSPKHTSAYSLLFYIRELILPIKVN